MCNTWGQLISKRWGGETETKCSQILVLSLRVQCYLISSRCFIILFLHLKLSLCVFVSFPFNPHFLLGALLSPALWPSSTNISCPSTGSLNFKKFFSPNSYTSFPAVSANCHPPQRACSIYQIRLLISWSPGSPESPGWSAGRTPGRPGWSHGHPTWIRQHTFSPYLGRYVEPE